MGARFLIPLKSFFILTVSFCSLRAMHQGRAVSKTVLLPSIWRELHRENAKNVAAKDREQRSALCGSLLPALRIVALSPENDENRARCCARVVKKEPSIRNEESLSKKLPFSVRPAVLSGRYECATEPREHLLKDPEKPSDPEQDVRHSLERIDGWFASSFKATSNGIVPNDPMPHRLPQSQTRLPSLRRCSGSK